MSAILDLIQSCAASFFASDHDSDQKLSFDEFQQVLPKHVRDAYKKSTLKELFDDADVNGDGGISREEFFFWTLRWVTENTNGGLSGLERCFSRFDSTHSRRALSTITHTLIGIPIYHHHHCIPVARQLNHCPSLAY